MTPQERADTENAAKQVIARAMASETPVGIYSTFTRDGPNATQVCAIVAVGLLECSTLHVVLDGVVRELGRVSNYRLRPEPESPPTN